MMADRRRRRALEDEGEETVTPSGDNEVKTRPSECESEGEPADVDIVSEYESATEGNHKTGGEEEEEESEEGSEEEEETEEESEEGSEDEEEEEEENFTDEDVIIEGEEHIEEERQSGDGEEQPDKEHVDDDEDKKNPAYVPRKGAFYEHDTRTGEEAAPEAELKPKKKLWQDEGKWGHDRYRDDLQAPKSRDELIALYGYDIRSADKPPDAPPRGRKTSRGSKPQRMANLHEYIKPPLPTQRMAVIDTTDYGKKSRDQHISGEFDNYDDDMEVPYMTTIDTTESSARAYRPRGQYGRGAPQRRDRQSFGEQRGKRQGFHPQNMQSHGNQNSPNEVHSQDLQPSETQTSPSQDMRLDEVRSKNYTSQDIRSQESRPKNSLSQDARTQGVRFSDNRYQEDYKIRNKYSGDSEIRDDPSQSNNNTRRYLRGNVRGSNNCRIGRGRDRNSIQGFQNNEQDSEGKTNNEKFSYESAPNPREFTNSSYKNSTVQEVTQKNAQADMAGTAGGKGTQTSQDVVISNKENIQTISVTITNTTTERKSYTKERRGKPSSGRGGHCQGEVDAGDHKTSPVITEIPTSSGANGAEQDEQRNTEKNFPPLSKQDAREQSRPKRYSSQRQRNMPDVTYQEQPPQQQIQQESAVDTGAMFYKKAVYPSGPPAAFFHPDQNPAMRPSRPPPPQEAAAFTATILPPAMPFHLPVSTAGIPSPPRLFGPSPGTGPPVPISNASPTLLPPPYLPPPGVIYSAPPPPPGASPPFQVPLGYTAPPPTAPPPALPQQPIASPQTQPELYRGGTTYYPPYMQQPPGRSPARRPKVAIPIVDPQELNKKIIDEQQVVVKDKKHDLRPLSSEQKLEPAAKGKSIIQDKGTPTANNTIVSPQNACPHVAILSDDKQVQEVPAPKEINSDPLKSVTVEFKDFVGLDHSPSKSSVPTLSSTQAVSDAECCTLTTETKVDKSIEPAILIEAETEVNS